ncbi:hypothetical protein HWV62_41356 [Athelia sp. TMB]|nr:hypothetical protein HWV62_41356 [Athelia sp. TMB]
MHQWFWFFESRNAPETAPFTLWTGMKLAIPIGTGFSYGHDTVNSTESAPIPFWKAFQILFESKLFAKYQSREFIFATESYGGPATVTYFDEQNKKIDQGTLKGEKITVSALMINNGWYDPLLQNKAYVDFATDAPGYGPLVNKTVLAQMNKAFYGKGGCKEQEEACYAAGTGNKSNSICLDADNYCINTIFVPAVGDRDDEDLRQNSSALFPPEYYTKYLALKSTTKKIGAVSTYSECADHPYNLFEKTGDDARTWLPQLSALVNSKLKTLIWLKCAYQAGDADIKYSPNLCQKMQELTFDHSCNWLGGHASVLAMNWYGNKTLHNTPFKNITVGGKTVAAVQNVDNFSFARVYGAGHEVPAFQPKAALEIFKQVITKQQLHSV